MLMRVFAVSVFALFVTVGAACAQTRLVMVEENGCVWCAHWNDEIAPIYPKTAAGKAAPLKRIDIRAERPAGMTFQRKLFYTPTFVLMQDGKEVSRLEGYPGEDFFWGVLEKMLADANIEVAP